MALMGKDGEVLIVLETGLERAIEEFKQMFFVPPDDIQSLITTVKRIKAVLKDAEKRQIKEETVRLWLGELKQLFLDAEDLVDEYATDEALRSSIGAESRKKVRNEFQVIPIMRLKVYYPSVCHQEKSLIRWDRTHSRRWAQPGRAAWRIDTQQKPTGCCPTETAKPR